MATTKKLSDLRNDESSSYAKFKKRREEEKNNSQNDAQTKHLQQIRENEKLNQMKSDTESEYANFIKRRNAGYLEENHSLKQEAQQEFLESEQNVGFWDAILPGGATPSEYKQSRQKKKQYEKETQEAAAQVAAYERFWEQQKVAGKSSAEIDSYLKKGDEEIERLEGEKVGFFEAMKPGGVKPSERKVINAEKEAEIKKIESQQGMYRAVRDEKKSREMTDSLPEDVKKLLDEYNNLEYEDEGVDWAGVAAGFAGMSGSGTNAVQRSSADLRREAIKKELTERGYDNYVELAEYRRYITDKAASEEQTERWSEVAEEHPVLASAGARAMSVPSAVAGLYGTVKQYENTADFVGGTPYSPYYNAERARQTIDNTITEGFEDGIISAEAKAFLYGAGTSAADSMMASVASGSLGLGKLTAGEVLLGLGAANNVVVTAAEKGMTQEQAMTTAAVAMASEIAFEHLSLGKLGVFEASGEVAVKAAIKDLVKNSFVNMTEEMATEIANVTFDYYYNGGMSDYYQNYETYIAMGYSEEEAEQMARADVNNQILEAGLSGALIGGVFSGMETGTNTVNYNSQLRNVGKNVATQGDVDYMLAVADDVQGNDKLMQLAKQIEANEQARAAAGDKKRTGKELRSIGKLVKGIDEATNQDIDKLGETAIRERLVKVKETGDVDIIARAILKKINDEKLSHKEAKAFKESKKATQVYREAIGEFYDAEWSRKLNDDIYALYERRYEPDVEAYRARKNSQENPSTASDSPSLSGTENGAAAEQKKTASGKSESEVLKMLDDVKTAENAKAQVKQALIQQGQDAETFNAGFELYYEQGRSGGYQFTEIKDNTNVSESFTEYQRQQAFEQGQHQALKDIGNARYKGDTVGVFINGYSKKDTVKRYASAFNIFYSEGMHSNMSFEEVFKREALDKVIDEATARKAFEAGRNDPSTAKRSPSPFRGEKKLLKKDGSYVSKTIEEGEIDTFLEAFSKKLGLDTVRVQKIINGEDEANAQIDLKSGKMVSSASSRNEYQSSIHESAHLAYAYGDTKKMAEIETSMKDYFIHLHGAATFENVIRQYAEAYTDLDRAGVMEEFTADALAGVFSSEDGVNEFVDWLRKDSGYSQAEKKTILQKLSEWLLEIVDKIKELIEEGHLNNVTEVYAKAQAEQFAEVREKFLQVLDEIEGVEGAEGVKNSNKRLTNELLSAYNNDNEWLTMANRASVNAKSSINWVYQQKLFSVKENKLFFEKISDINQGSNAFIKNLDGEYMLPIGNKIIFTNGDYDTPYISRVIEVMTEYDTRFEEVRRLVFDYEKGLRSNFANETRIFKNMYGHGYIFEYNSGFNGAYEMGDGKRKRKNRKSIIENYFKSKNRGRNAGDGNKEFRNGSDEEGIKHSVKGLDFDYLSAVESGDVETAQHMVDEEAKKKGYDSPVLYHGTHSFGFTSFDLNKMDDKRSIFLTSSKEIASTYSGVTGTKSIGNSSTVDVADMSAEDIVKRLNEYDAEFKTGTTEGPHNYELYDFKKTNSLISKVNDGIEKLKGIVGEEIKSYADKMSRDFDDKDAKIHSQLVTLSERLDRYDYQNLSTPIYLLLHHTDVFGGSAEIAELEKNIRLMNQVRTRDLSAGVVVDEALGGYVIEVMNIDQAREYLEQRLKAGNYSLYAKLGKSLVIDGKGALWNNIGYWTSSMEVKAADVSVVKKGDFYELVDNKTKEIIDGGSVTVNEHTNKMFSSNKQELITLMVNKANNVLHIKSETAHTTRDIAKFAKERGYDSVVFKDIRDNGGWNSEIEYEELADIYVIFDPNSVKSADAVTYDNNGEVIPLSERFNSNEADIRRSRKFSLDWIDFAEEQERERSAVSELTELKKINDELRAKIQHPGVKHIVSQLGVQKVARHLKSEYMSKINIHKLAGELGDFYTLIANGDGISWDSLQIHIERIADMILDESKYKKPDISDYAKDVLRELRSSKISLSEEQKAAISEKYGSYNNYRKKMMGSLVLSNDGTSLDERWAELSGMYPNLFSEDTVDLDQPEAMLELIASLRETYEDMNGMDLASAKDMLMTEIYEQYFEVPETKYISEEYAVKLAKAKVDYGEKLREAKAEYRRQAEEAYNKAKAEYGEILKGVREEEAETILRIKARYNLRAENMADTRVREKKRANIIRQVKRLDRLLRTPGKGAPSAGTNKYEQKYVHLTNIPEDLKRTVIDFCSVFIEHDAGVFSGVTKRDNVSQREKRIEAMQRQYAALKKSESYLKESVNEDMAEKLDILSEIMAERRLSQLTAAELDTVIEITDHLITVINNQVEMWVDGKKHKVEGLGSSAIDQLKEKGQYKHLPLPGHDFVKGWGVNNMKPVYFFERVGGVLEKLFLEMQNKGQRDYARNINAAAAFMDEAGKKFGFDKWVDEEDLTIKTTQGHTIKLTKAQAMHIWATAKREVIAGKDSMHLMQGGIVFEDEIEADFEVDNKKDKSKKKKLSSEVWKYKKSDGSAHRISLDDLDKISGYLTDEQKKFVDTMVGYLSNDVAALGNEVSMELYGIKRFNEKYYIPFNSAKNFIYRSMGEQGEAMLRSESFTKETTWGANNPLVVGDFMEVVAGHIERMAMYNSMVLPLENFSKIWNFKTFVPEGDDRTSQVSVRSAMETAFGKSYVSYVDTLLKDINGGINADSREKSIGRLLSNFKKTAVLGSASVVIQQPSAIVRAFAEIDPSYFVTTTFAGRKKAWEKALKYSSTALLKDIGGFDTVSGRGTTDWLTKTEYKGKDKVLAFFKDSQYRDDIIAWGPGFADKVTWAHIWAACERETASKNKGLQGEELYKKTGERFDEVINKTQVYDSVLTRSAHMRSKSQTMQVVTSFMSEPTTQANMIASAMFNAKKGDKKKAARIYSSVILSQLFNAALVSAIYAARDDDEDKTLVEKYLAELASNFVGSLNPLTMIPLFKDVWSLLEGYDVERSDMSVYADVVDSWKAWKSDSKTLAEKVTGTVGSIGNAFGLPLKNILRDAAAVVNVAKSAGDISDTTSKGIFYALEESLFPVHENLTKWKPTTKEEKLYAAFSEGDKKMYNRIASQYTSGGSIKSALKKQIGERFVEGDIDEQTAISQFRKLGLTENEAYYEVRSLKEPLPEEESEDTNADFFDFDSMQNIQGDADAELEADRQKAEDEGKEYSEKGDYDWLDEALSSGDRAKISNEVNDLKSRGVSDSKINSHIKSWIKENDSSVSSEVQRYKSGDLSGFEGTVRSVAGKYGVDESAVAGAIRSAAGDNSKAIEGTIYAYGDLHAVMNVNNSAQSKKIASEIVYAKTQQYVAEGETNRKAKEKAENAVRTSLRNYWKEVYLKSDTSKKGYIRMQLKETGLWTSSEVLKMTREWDKEK